MTPSYRLPNPPSFARPSELAEGNDLPPITGEGFAGRFRGGPHPQSQPMGNPQLGANDGYWGSNNPPNGAGWPPVVFLPGQNVAGMDSGQANNPNGFAYGVVGFNDKLTVTDRHAYWDTGSQLTGTTYKPGGMPNTYNDPLQNPPGLYVVPVS